MTVQHVLIFKTVFLNNQQFGVIVTSTKCMYNFDFEKQTIFIGSNLFFSKRKYNVIMFTSEVENH